MLEVDPADTTTTDGKAYYLLVTLTTHGAHNYDYGASDGQYWTTGGSSSVTIDNRAPDITNGPGASVNEWRNTYWGYDFDGTDPDSDTITWGRSGYDWLLMNSTSGLLDGVTSNTPGDYAFTVYCNDSYEGQDTYLFTLHILNRAPMITSTGNASQQEGTYLAYQIVADDDDGDSLSYALSTNASAWASISGGWVNGTATGIGWYEFTVWANDSYGGSDSDHWHLEVTAGPANEPPYFTSSPIDTGYNNTAYLYNANGVDPEGQPLTFTLYGNGTSWLSYGSANGSIWGYPTILGWYYCNLSLSDGVNEVWQNWTLTISESIPSLPSGSGGPFTLSIGVMVLIAILAATMVMVWRSS
jgi:hypothetical protein